MQVVHIAVYLWVLYRCSTSLSIPSKTGQYLFWWYMPKTALSAMVLIWLLLYRWNEGIWGQSIACWTNFALLWMAAFFCLVSFILCFGSTRVRGSQGSLLCNTLLWGSSFCSCHAILWFLRITTSWNVSWALHYIMWFYVLGTSWGPKDKNSIEDSLTVIHHQHVDPAGYIQYTVMQMSQHCSLACFRLCMLAKRAA